jgi:hypothetical protein
MDTLHRELKELIEEDRPPLIDLAHLERLVTEDEMLEFDGVCTAHDSCRPILSSAAA